MDDRFSGKSYYGRWYLIRYGLSMPESRTRKEIAFIARHLPLHSFRKIIDFGCGTGRHSNFLGRLGYSVLGIDQDPISIGIARSEGSSLKGVTFIERDLAGFVPGERHDAAISMYSSIGHLDDRGNQALIRTMCQAVRPGGSLVLDVMNPDFARGQGPKFSRKKRSFQGSEYLIEHTRSYTSSPDVERNELKFLEVATGAEERVAYALRLYSAREIARMLHENGCRVIISCGDFDDAAVAVGKERMIFLAEKKK